jgi:hypothetical protein
MLAAAAFGLFQSKKPCAEKGDPGLAGQARVTLLRDCLSVLAEADR